MSPLLSICVPTYNQPLSIKRLLDSLLREDISEIEIVIQDDSTDEKTQAVAREFSGKLPLRYFGRHVYAASTGSGANLKKGEKGGIDRSIIFLTEEARGEYVWWMGDDVVAPGGLARVIGTIKGNSDLIYLCANHRPADKQEPVFALSEDKQFRSREEALAFLVGALGFISVTVLRRKEALSGIEPGKKFIGTAFTNLYIVLEALSHDGRYAILKDPAVISFPNKPEEVNDNGFEVFGVYFYSIVRSFSGRFKRGAIRDILKKNFAFVWRGMLVRWLNGYESPRGKRWKLLKLYWSYPEAWLAVFLMLLPLSVNRFLYRCYKIFFAERRFRWPRK